MGRIGATLSGIERSLLNRLAEANAAATLSSLRIATGNMINDPRDDPSAFVRLSSLQSQLGIIRTTMSNVTSAESMVGQAQTTLGQVRTQLDAIRTELLKDEDRDLTEQERAEAQAAIDAAISQINGLAGTEIDGRRLLDGSADFQVRGRDPDQVSGLTVYSTGGSALTIHGSVTQAATRAELNYAGQGGAKIETDAIFTLTGDRGSVEITVTGNEPLSDVATRINNQSHNTGVTASVDGNNLLFTGVAYGTSAEIAIVVSDGTFAVTGGNGDGTASGTDAVATINGQTCTGDGNRFLVTRNGAHYELDLAADFTGSFSPITVDGDAVTFALSRSLYQRATLAIPGVQAGQFVGQSGSVDQLASGGSLSGLDGNTSQAIRVVDEALGKLSRIEGSVDGFYDAAITSASNQLSDLEEDLEDAVDEVNLVNDNQEAQRLVYYQDLAANAVSGLAILGQQRSSIVLMLQKIAGLT